MENSEQQSTESVAVSGVQKTKGTKTAIIVVVMLIVLGAAGAFVYGRYFNSSKGVLSNIVPQVLNPECKYNDPDLCKFLNNWINAGDMTMTSTSAQDGKNSEYVIKIDGEDKTEMISRSAGQEDYHAISISDTNYSLDFADGKWWKFTSTASEGKADAEAKENEQILDFDVEEDKSTYEKIGKESCGKLTCFKYKVIDPENSGSTEYIYFDDKEYLLRKTRSEANDGSVSESTIEYGDVKVSEPSPVKEGSPYSSLESFPTSPASSSTSSTPIDQEEYSQTPEDTASEPIPDSIETYEELE